MFGIFFLSISLSILLSLHFFFFALFVCVFMPLISDRENMFFLVFIPLFFLQAYRFAKGIPNGSRKFLWNFSSNIVLKNWLLIELNLDSLHHHLVFFRRFIIDLMCEASGCCEESCNGAYVRKFITIYHDQWSSDDVYDNRHLFVCQRYATHKVWFNATNLNVVWLFIPPPRCSFLIKICLTK